MPKTVIPETPIIQVTYGDGQELFPPDDQGNKNFISFEHYYEDSNIGATLKFVDPDGQFEEIFIKYKFTTMLTAALSKMSGDAKGPLTKAMTKEEGGSGGGGGGGSTWDIQVSYGWPGNISGPHNFAVRTSNVSYGQGGRIITLNMVPTHKAMAINKEGPQNDPDKNQIAGGHKSTVIGQSNSMSLASLNYPGPDQVSLGAGSVDLHKLVMDAVNDFVVAATGNESSKVVVPNISKALRKMVSDKVSHIQSTDPERDKKAIAVEVLSETLLSVGLTLHVEEGTYISNPAGVPMDVAATIKFQQERDQYNSPSQARSSFLGKHQAWAEFRVEGDENFGTADLEMAIRGFCTKLGRQATDEWPVNPYFLWLNHPEDLAKAGMSGSMGLLCGDKGMVRGLMGHNNLPNTIGHAADKGGGDQPRSIKSDIFSDTTWTTPIFTYNSGDPGGNILELNILQQEHYMQRMNQGVAKAVESYATINSSPVPRSRRFRLSSFFKTLSYAMKAAQANGGTFSQAVQGVVAAYLGVRSKTAKPWIMLDPGSNQTDGGGVVANMAIIGYQQGLGARIKTLPCFDLSRPSDIGRSVELDGRDVTFIEGGSTHMGSKPPWTGAYTLLGYRHLLSPTDAWSQFKLQIR